MRKVVQYEVGLMVAEEVAVHYPSTVGQRALRSTRGAAQNQLPAALWLANPSDERSCTSYSKLRISGLATLIRRLTLLCISGSSLLHVTVTVIRMISVRSRMPSPYCTFAKSGPRRESGDTWWRCYLGCRRAARGYPAIAHSPIFLERDSI
jgi:hypothetical protein